MPAGAFCNYYQTAVFTSIRTTPCRVCCFHIKAFALPNYCYHVCLQAMYRTWPFMFHSDMNRIFQTCNSLSLTKYLNGVVYQVSFWTNKCPFFSSWRLLVTPFWWRFFYSSLLNDSTCPSWFFILPIVDTYKHFGHGLWDTNTICGLRTYICTYDIFFGHELIENYHQTKYRRHINTLYVYYVLSADVYFDVHGSVYGWLTANGCVVVERRRGHKWYYSNQWLRRCQRLHRVTTWGLTQFLAWILREAQENHCLLV